MSLFVKEIRRKTGMTQKEFAAQYGIPLSTLRKWEQGEASPPRYVIELIARTVPALEESLFIIEGKNRESFYYDKLNKILKDSQGNTISIREDLEGVNEHNLSIYVTDLFEDYYRIREKFERDCRFDKTEDIVWI